MAGPDLVVVWGNCQAAPLADLLRLPLAGAGLTVVDVPPVFLATETQIAEVHDLVRRAAFLVSHPVPEVYRFSGCSTDAMAADLPGGGTLITVSSAFHVGPFPFLVNAHGADDTRVNAPVSDYHDLRVVTAAARGMRVDETLRWWPRPSADAVRSVNATSLRELERRETAVDVRVSDLLTGPRALWSMNHPSNATLQRTAQRVLGAMGIDLEVEVPAREYLGERRAPVESSVIAALDWPDDELRESWTIRGEPVDRRDLLTAHLDFYSRRPDVVADTRRRYAARLKLLDL